MQMLESGQVAFDDDQMALLAIRLVELDTISPLSETILNSQSDGWLDSNHVSNGQNRRPFVASESPPTTACPSGPYPRGGS